MNPSASEWKPRSAPVGSTPANPPKKGPIGSTPLSAPAGGQDSSLRANAREFIPGGAKKGPPPPMQQQPPMPAPAGPAQNTFDDGFVAPPPPPGPPPPGSPTIHSPMLGSPTGAAPPAYGATNGNFPSGPVPHHVDPHAGRELSASAAPFTPGGSNVGTPLTGTPMKVDGTKPDAVGSPPTTAGADEDGEGTATPPTAGGEGESLKILAEPVKVQHKPFANSKMPLPADAPKEPVSPPPQLNGSWSLYVDEHAIAIGANAQQAFHDPVLLATINCLEKFWRLWHNVPAPSTRVPSFTYYWFRKDVKPNWEDPRNKNGGTLNITLYDRDRIGIQDKTVLDDSWMTAVLLVTGESLSEANCVNGVSLKIRNRATTMQVWTNVATKKELQGIADCLKTNLKPYCNDGSLAENKMDFFTHQAVIKSVVAAPKPAKRKPAGGAANKAPVREADFQF